MTPLHERHAQKTLVLGPDECWPWQAALDGKGYGALGGGRKGSGILRAHRVAWERQNGPIPAGAVIDHECHNRDESCPGGICQHRACQNPAHLAAKTQGANLLASGLTLAAVEAAMTHCSSGHEFTEDNTYNYRGMRYCRACRREHSREYYQRTKKAN